MTKLEALARVAWMEWGSFAKWTFCTHCYEWLYCRSKNGEHFVCAGCFDQGHK